MKEVRTGMTAVSMAGHDTGRYYIIVKAEDEYVYLADGSLRTLQRLKKKNRKHVQIDCHIVPEIRELLEQDRRLTDEVIKRVIKNRRCGQEV
ncbi:MAG: hypothetical protein ACI4EO_01165 [Blautia sp.]